MYIENYNNNVEPDVVLSMSPIPFIIADHSLVPLSNIQVKVYYNNYFF